LEELTIADGTPYLDRLPRFAYIGGITGIRGAREMVGAASLMPKRSFFRLELAGAFESLELKDELEKHGGWSRVYYHGWVSRADVAELLGSVRGGLVVLHPTQNYPDAYPVKMFEYMAAGLPVIASDFPLWRKIIQEAQCGLVVDPMDPSAIGDAMQWMLDRPEEAEAMGKRGRRAVVETYNWDSESVKLTDLYRGLVVTEG
jgi:glycosyltransferase involved in cell wall biosynthesis